MSKHIDSINSGMKTIENDISNKKNLVTNCKNKVSEISEYIDKKHKELLKRLDNIKI